MSGGIDSSVVAHLLHEQGHELIGVMMKLWTDPLAPPVQRALPTKCCSMEHVQRARQVCERLGIPFYVLNMEDEFKANVVDPFLEGYRRGETPNPCIDCNRAIKFDALLRKAEELGCEMLATGHYARIAKERLPGDTEQCLLLEAVDKEKDQSYYLYTLSQEKLRRILFPLGTMTKQKVYEHARGFGIHIDENYRESQNLCFFPEKEPTAFLKRYIGDARPGKIRTRDGAVVGKHQGLPFYTIGQRRGLGIGGLKIPLHVVSKNIDQNDLIVAPSGADLKCDISATDCHWISWSPRERQKLELDARVHSIAQKRPGILTYDEGIAHFHFLEPIRSIAPGQSLVLYRGQEVVGGGVIRP